MLGRPRQDIRLAFWLLSYFGAITLLSWLGSSSFGGMNLIPAPWDQVAAAIVSLISYAWGIRSGRSTP